MFGGGRGPMGGGGGMLRAAGRAMTRTGVTNGGIQEPFSSSSSSSASSAGNTGASNASHSGCAGSASRQTQKLSTSSASNYLTISAHGSPLSRPMNGNPGYNGGSAFACVSSGVYDEFEWVSEEGSDEEYMFGCVPSVDEVQDAVSALQQVFDGSGYSDIAGDKSECSNHRSPAATSSHLDWMEPSMQLCHPQAHGYDHVYNAFHLLRTESSVQRMVTSLSSDKAVWDAVMNNDVVREIRELYNSGTNQGKDDEISDDVSAEKNNVATAFIKWVFDNTKEKAIEVIEKISKIVTELFKRHGNGGGGKNGKDDEWVQERIRTSVMVSIVVLLVVIVSRSAHRA